MLGFNRLATPARRIAASSRNMSTSNAWGKSNITYITYVAIAAVGAELVYGFVTNSIWEISNQGVSFIHCKNIISPN